MPPVNAGQSVVPPALPVTASGAPAPLDATTSTRVVLATFDPVFGALCKRAFERATTPHVLVAVSPPELLETVRQVAPDLLVLDVDGEDVAALKVLAAKVMLVSDAHVVLASAYLGPGSAGLGGLLQSIAATFVQKPEGPSSLSLADEDGPPFVATLFAALAASDDEDLAVETLDAGWDPDDERARRVGADDD